jgi:hypothetical protein
MGRTVVLDTGKAQIVLLGRHVEPTAQEKMLQALAVDSARKNMSRSSRVCIGGRWRI